METEPVNKDESHQSILDQIFKSGPKLGSYKAGDKTFYSLIENYANSGDFKGLEMVLCQMRREKRVFLEKIYIVKFKAYSKAHLVEEAIGLFSKMADKFHCRRSVKLFNLVLNVIIQDGQEGGYDGVDTNAVQMMET
ncbi:hypothetical protein QYF36_021764 [Acer negundo]|nr:hypothetical protein QYF36_021764 [Acer negundo]